MNKFDFDDVLIIPGLKTDISSRYKNVTLPRTLPLFTAPMDTVINLNNLDLFLDNGINVTLPRTVKYEQFFEQVQNNNTAKYLNVFISFGFEDLDELYENNFKDLYNNAHILIDVANGHMQKIVDYAREIKRLRPDIKIMVGNIGNPETYGWYVENECVDYIRVGIGNGGGCLTTKQSGIGYPMASLINETYAVKLKYLNDNNKTWKLPYIVADGGMKNHSDIIKSLGLGADYVMVGSIFNKALESAGDNYLYGLKVSQKNAEYLYGKNLPIKKYFRGMSTKQAQKAMGKTNFKTSEGVIRYRKVEYRLSGWIENFEHYLRNAMSYNGANSLDKFIGNIKICEITKSAYDRFNK